MAQRRARAGPTRTPVHDAAAEYRYTTFMSLTHSATPKSKESLVLTDAAPSEVTEREAKPYVAVDADGNIQFADEPTASCLKEGEPTVQDIVQPETSPERSPPGDSSKSDKGEEDRPSSDARQIADELFNDYISFGGVTADELPARTTDNRAPTLLEDVPWKESLRFIESPSLRLHQELVELVTYLTPLEEERAERQAAITRVSDVVQSIWPSAEINVFGSYAMGLYLPTSDIDAVVINSKCVNVVSGLKAIASALHRRQMATNVEVISKAKVPIIKFEEAASGYKFDISFDVANGPQAAEAMKGYLAQLPSMRHLVVVLKIFLLQRNLNEVYHGGLGSYALLTAVAAFLLTHPSRIPPGSTKKGQDLRPRPLETNLGILLLDFLRIYGKELNVYDVAISCHRGGRFLDKNRVDFYNASRPNLLAIEDPCDTTNDIGKNSYEIGRVREAFEYAYRELITPSEPGESLLVRILRLDPALFVRSPVPYPDKQPGRSTDVRPKRGAQSSSEKKTQSRSPVRSRKRKHRERSESRSSLSSLSSSDDDREEKSRQHRSPRKPSRKERARRRTPKSQEGSTHIRFD